MIWDPFVGDEGIFDVLGVLERLLSWSMLFFTLDCRDRLCVAVGMVVCWSDRLVVVTMAVLMVDLMANLMADLMIDLMG